MGAHSVAATTCERMLEAGPWAVVWLALSVLAGLGLAVRFGAIEPAAERIRFVNWVVVITILVVGVAWFIHIAADPGNRCSRRSQQLLFWTEPFFAGGLVGVLSGFVRRRGNERTLAHREDTDLDDSRE